MEIPKEPPGRLRTDSEPSAFGQVIQLKERNNYGEPTSLRTSDHFRFVKEKDTKTPLNTAY
jgi:hypothetical protein